MWKRGAPAKFAATVGLALLVSGCAASSDDSGTSDAVAPTTAASTTSPLSVPPVSTLVDAAALICPTMWSWQQDVSAVFNDMSQAAADETDAVVRRKIYRDALDEVDPLAAGVKAAVGPYSADPTLMQLVADIATGLDGARGVVDDIRQQIDTRPELDDDGHRMRLSAMIVAFEKIIDLPKPELATYGDPAIIAAFNPTDTPACQFGVKDANDGVPRDNG